MHFYFADITSRITSIIGWSCFESVCIAHFSQCAHCYDSISVGIDAFE